MNNKWMELGSLNGVSLTELALLRIFENVVSVTVEKDYMWVIEGNNRLFGIDRKESVDLEPLTDIVIKSISNRKGLTFNLENIRFDRGDNEIIFNIVAPGYLKQNTTRYQYYIEKSMKDWSQWSVGTDYIETITKPGDYVLQVRAMDIWGNIGEPKSVRFTITAPFTQTLLFYLIAGFLLLISVIFLIENP